MWFSWPGPSSNSALPLNRTWMAGTLLILAVLPLVIRRQFGPVRGGWVGARPGPGDDGRRVTAPGDA